MTCVLCVMQVTRGGQWLLWLHLPAAWGGEDETGGGGQNQGSHPRPVAQCWGTHHPQPPSFTSLWKFTDLIGDYIILAETNGLVDQWRSWSLLTCPLCHSSLCLIQQSILLFVYKPANFYELQPCILFPVISLLHRTPFGSWYRRHLGQCCTHWHTEDHADRAGCFKVCIRA